MTNERRNVLKKNKQRRTRLMLEHILSRLNGSEYLVREWLSKFATPHRTGLVEWQSMSNWQSKLMWMHSHIETEWDEVERLMSNHPFTCIVDQKVRSQILNRTFILPSKQVLST